MPKKNEWKFEIFFTLIFIHTLTTEQDFEFLLQSGVSIVCSGSSIGLFQAYYIPSRQSQVHLRSTHSFICHPPAVYLGYSDRIKFFIHLSEIFLDFLKELPLTTLYNKNSKSCSSPISMYVNRVKNDIIFFLIFPFFGLRKYELISKLGFLFCIEVSVFTYILIRSKY